MKGAKSKEHETAALFSIQGSTAQLLTTVPEFLWSATAGGGKIHPRALPLLLVKFPSTIFSLGWKGIPVPCHCLHLCCRCKLRPHVTDHTTFQPIPHWTKFSTSGSIPPPPHLQTASGAVHPFCAGHGDLHGQARDSAQQQDLLPVSRRLHPPPSSCAMHTARPLYWYSWLASTTSVTSSQRSSNRTSSPW